METDPGNLSPRQNGFFPATPARLGWAFFEGELGLPKDPARARYWLKKVVDGECTHKHLSDEGLANAAQCLRELESGGE